MDCFHSEDCGVFDLITALCTKHASINCKNKPQYIQKRLASMMRSEAYEIILKRSYIEVLRSKMDPISELLSYYFDVQASSRNVAEYKRAIELKELVDIIRNTNFGADKDVVHSTLKLLAALKDSVEEDTAIEVFKKPFSFGLQDEMLPKPKRESLTSPQPYSYYPSYVFELPFSLKHKEENAMNIAKSYAKYTVESFDSKSFFPDSVFSNSHIVQEIKTFLSPMSMASMAPSHMSPYTENSSFKGLKLMAPRDLNIPNEENNNQLVYKASIPATDSRSGTKEVYRRYSPDESLYIWELASTVDKDIPEDIWDIVSKMPPVQERQLIATSSRELTLWFKMYGNRLSQLNVVPEKHFIRHVMLLIIGIETSSFPFSQQSNCFYAKDNLVLEGISKEHLQGYLTDLLLIGTYYFRLAKLAFNHNVTDTCQSNGLIFEAAREVIRKYLLQFRLKATELYQDCCKKEAGDNSCLPTLLQILFHIEPLKYEIETVASIYNVTEPGMNYHLPSGADLMSYLCNEISMISHSSTANTMFNALFSLCKVYFKFIERFIFEGELDDVFGEFFIKKNVQYVNCRNKRYWDKGYHITHSAAVPDFLKSMAKCILLCGKSLRLLKLCNPGDPLVVLTSTDHPSIKCCSTFEELRHQSLVLDLYRTRCLYVRDEPVTFERIKREREDKKKAFTEMASQKQAETMEKIVAERKRLAQLIIAEKQLSFKFLEKAMEEAKAAKNRSRYREQQQNQLEAAADKAREEVDALIRADEKEKIMQYYSKLNMHVEKSKMHTEWRMKRLQLDEMRIQLLSSEERNLKREKLELELQNNDNIMVMSTKSDDFIDNLDKDKESISSTNELDVTNQSEDTDSNDSAKSATLSSSTVFSAICNVAKTIFGGSKKPEEIDCDNTKKLDSQGNIISEVNSNTSTETSSNVIGSHLNTDFDAKQFTKTREEAVANKERVLAHEFGVIDEQNNQTSKEQIVDAENNIDTDLTPFQEAKRNKIKILGSETDVKLNKVPIIQTPRTDAQKEAVLNKQKVLGVEYNLPLPSVVGREPANYAQEEAVKNKEKMLGSEKSWPKLGSAKRAGLFLDLTTGKDKKVPVANAQSYEAITPGDIPPLDLVTPTTADINFTDQVNWGSFTPHSENAKDDLEATKSEQKILAREELDYSNCFIDYLESEINITEVDGAVSPTENARNPLENLDKIEDLDNFNPFHINLNESLSNLMDNEMKQSVYSHPATILAEVKKKPYKNIFRSEFEEEEHKITCDNIATLTACLQRSVLLPLSYQLEVVNNSILTHFLVNLDMFEHLKSLKDYFFLMDGEFSRSICHNLFANLVKTVNPQELLNFSTLNNILDKALGSSISHQYKYSENLSFSVSEPPLSFHHSSPDVLKCLTLSYNVQWPLNIILSQEALLRYSEVFQFLVKMRRISWMLGEDFQCLKLTVKYSKESSRSLLRSPQYRALQIRRHAMSCLMRALDNYIVTTSILTPWKEFENDLTKARTLDDLHECHVVYIKKVHFRCLLNNRSTPVMKVLNNIFTFILKFSRVLKAGTWQQQTPTSHFTHSSYVQLEEMYHLFEKLVRYLHKLITRFMECGYQRHLVELLTLINLNGYYDYRDKDEHNLSVQSN